MSKLFLALLISYAASQAIFDRTIQQRAIRHHSPEILICKFKPIESYGDFLKLSGFYESRGCCALKKNVNHCEL